MKKRRFIKLLLSIFLIFSWLLTGWPPIWLNPRIPSEVKVAQAATLTYVGGAEASGNSADYNVSLTSLTGGVGSAAIAGDLVIIATGWNSTADGDPGVTTAGYTEVADLYKSDTYDANFSVNWKIMGGTPDTSVTCKGSGSASNGAVCAVHVWRNANISTPLDATTTTVTAGNSAVPNSPSITPVTTGVIVIATGLGAMAAVDDSVTAPTGYSNQVDISVDPTNAATVGIASKAWSGSGAEDPAAWTNWTTVNSDSWAAATLAIRPANNPPSLTVSQPDGTSDTVIVGQSYNITYDLSDAEEVVTAAMYYDTDAVGLNGTVIAGVCATAAEGTGAICSWDTTGMTPGNYYVYGLTSDGVNPQVSDYSPGVITIQAAVVSVSVSDGIVTYGMMQANTSKTTLLGELNDMQTATNDGNVTENFNIKSQDGTGGGCTWTVSSTNGSDQYVHQFCNDTDLDCTSPPTNYTVLTTSYQTLDTGISVSGTVQIQLRLTTPNPSTCYGQQSVNITIQAVQ